MMKNGINISILGFGLLLLIAGCGAERTTGDFDGDDEDGDDIVSDSGEMDVDDEPDGPSVEECNGVDDDGDTLIDEDFDLMTDVDHCGACDFPCILPNAIPICEDGVCMIGECLEGTYDINGDPYDGCEYGCSKEAEAESPDDGTCEDGLDNDCDGRIDDDDPDCSDCVPEFCNNEDDDCDTLIDEDFDLRSDPVNCGECGNVCPARPHADPICVLGECYIQCQEGYVDANGDPLDGCEDICVPTADTSEFTCDSVDNDCDGEVDEDYAPYRCGQGACETDSVCLEGEEQCIPLEPESPLDQLCDGIDNDCDGEVDEEFVPVTCQGVCEDDARCEGGVEICGPVDEEIDVTCDGLDGDCDGEVDDDYMPYTCGTGVCENESTCEDGEETCNPLPPSSTEDLTCDDLDDDCDGFVDEEYEFYECGVGLCVNLSICINGEESCTPVDPPASSDEVCDGLDEDCDDEIDEDYIPFTCGVGACVRESTCILGEERCDEGTPEPSDRTCNNIDEDCDGFTDEDYIPTQCGTGLCEADSVCVDGEESCTPLEPPVDEDQVCDNQDEDCDGFTDEDYRPYTCGQGVCERDSICTGGEESCSEGSPTGDDVACNGFDDNCNGSIDENYEPYQCGEGPCRTDSVCMGGEESCTPGEEEPEVCDGVDNDCNGEIDDIFDCRTGMTRECTTTCDTTGEQTCNASCEWGVCVPPSETCNGIDDDCDGGCDDGFQCCQGTDGNCTTTCGTTGSRTCSSSCTWGFCVPPSEVCNGIDDDCDGGCDDGYQCCRGAEGICTTGCGTIGSRTCSSSCTWGSCMPPSEQCNGIDDDCDTICDNGFGCCRGTAGSCTTTCDTTGSRTCSSACNWGSCVPPGETCNGIDDDCDTICDDGFGCCRGTSASCTTSCGTTGQRVCSAACTWGSCVPPAETCNGIDDDCDGTCDNGWACCRGTSGSCTTSCGSTGTRTCSSSCTWSSCVAPVEVCNGVDDDCDTIIDEGFDDGYEPNETCETATNAGTVHDATSGVVTISGSIKSTSDKDWYRILATDDNSEPAGDEFDFEVFWVNNPGGLAFDVYRGDCFTQICAGVIDCANWFTDFYSGGVGENPCQNPPVPGVNTCDDDDAYYYVRVYRNSGSGYCSNYTIRFRNNPPTPGTGCLK